MAGQPSDYPGLLFQAGAVYKDTARTQPANVADDLIAAIADASGNNNHFTQSTSGARPKYEPNIYGGGGASRLFSGSQYLTHPTLGASLTGDFTIILLIKGTDKSGDAMLVSWGDLAAGKSRRMWIANTTGYATFSGYAANLTSATNVKNGADNVVAITRSGTTVKIYVNKTLVATGTPSLNAYTGMSFSIGANPDGTEGYKDYSSGLLVYSAARSAAEIGELTDAYFASLITPPLSVAPRFIFPLVMTRLTHGVEYSTTITPAGNGQESRNANWDDALRHYNAAFSVKTQSDFNLLIEFFHRCKGKWREFLLKDWAEFKYDWQNVSGVYPPNGTLKTFQMFKIYQDVLFGYTVRKITKPKEGTVKVRVGGVELTSSQFTVDLETGIFTLATAPATGATVEQKCEFYVPCRFDTDTLDVVQLAYWIDQGGAEHANFQPPDIPIKEVRV